MSPNAVKGPFKGFLMRNQKW